MEAIWKFTLRIEDVQAIEMPLGAVVLSVGEQRGELVLWARVPVAHYQTEDRSFRIYGTGHQYHDIPRTGFIGTVQIGSFAWHVFEVL